MKKLAQAAFVAALGIVLLGAKGNAQTINVVINGQPVSFNGTPPQELNGSVLVPLRGVFEQLGATVIYNPSTKTIFADKGSKTVSLSLGSTTAYVDNQPQQLAQAPTVMDGTTLVPLRFVAESFGAYVGWEGASNTVDINTDQQAAVASGPPVPDQAPAAPTTVAGRIADIDNPGNPGVITLDTASGPVQVNLVAHTRISVRDHGSSPVPSAPEALHVGLHVVAQIWPNGNARSIEIRTEAQTAESISGRISNIDNADAPTLITVNTRSGSVQVGVDSHTSVTASHPGGENHPTSLQALHPGEEITATLWPNGNARYIKIDFSEHHDGIASAFLNVVAP